MRPSKFRTTAPRPRWRTRWPNRRRGRRSPDLCRIQHRSAISVNGAARCGSARPEALMKRTAPPGTGPPQDLAQGSHRTRTGLAQGSHRAPRGARTGRRTRAPAAKPCLGTQTAHIAELTSEHDRYARTPQRQAAVSGNALRIMSSSTDGAPARSSPVIHAFALARRHRPACLSLRAKALRQHHPRR